MKAILLCFLLTAFAGCKSGVPSQTEEPETAVSDLLPGTQKEEMVPRYDYDTLGLDGALVNGHPIIMPQKAFEKAYGSLDSATTDLWECGSPFGYLDDAWMAKTYGAYDTLKGEYATFNGYFTTLFVRKASFSSNGHIVLFAEADAAGNNFSLPASRVVIDKNTTLEAFEKAFPKILPEMLDNGLDRRYRIPLSKISDDAFLFYFEGGKLVSFTLWWLLC